MSLSFLKAQSCIPCPSMTCNWDNGVPIMMFCLNQTFHKAEIDIIQQDITGAPGSADGGLFLFSRVDPLLVALPLLELSRNKVMYASVHLSYRTHHIVIKPAYVSTTCKFIFCLGWSLPPWIQNLLLILQNFPKRDWKVAHWCKGRDGSKRIWLFLMWVGLPLTAESWHRREFSK